MNYEDAKVGILKIQGIQRFKDSRIQGFKGFSPESSFLLSGLSGFDVKEVFFVCLPHEM
jgi:hypothetical protein